MDGASRSLDRRAVWLAWGAVTGIVAFNLGWLLAGAVQGGGYSVANWLVGIRCRRRGS